MTDFIEEVDERTGKVYTLQTWVVTGETIRVLRYAGYKANRRKDAHMATLKQLQDKGDVPPPPHKLTEAEKSEWAKSGRPFVVQSVALKSAEGGRTYWDVLAESNGDLITFGLSSHAERDGLMQALAAHTLSEPVEGIRLRVLDVKRNTEFIGLDAAEEG